MIDSYQAVLKKIRETAVSCGRNPNEIQLIAVTKGYPLDSIMPVYQAGCRDFGENRVDEALEKKENSPDDLRWHFIGSLQTKKVNQVIGQFALIHSVDSPKLAHKISASSQREGVVSSVLLQANTSGEEAKHGLRPEEWKREILELLAFPNLEIKGLMTMAPLTDDSTIIRTCFRKLKELRDDLEQITGQSFPHLSMGMTNDYPIAIEEGTTLLRVGSAIFAG